MVRKKLSNDIAPNSKMYIHVLNLALYIVTVIFFCSDNDVTSYLEIGTVAPDTFGKLI